MGIAAVVAINLPTVVGGSTKRARQIYPRLWGLPELIRLTIIIISIMVVRECTIVVRECGSEVLRYRGREYR